MATRKQKAAARRNIKKAQAANRRKGGKKRGSRSRARTTGTKKLRAVKNHLRSALKTLNSKGARSLL